MIQNLLNNNRVINKYSNVVNEINNFELNLQLLSDIELREKTIN